MRFVPKLSVGAQLTTTIFLAILFSWMISSGIAAYVSYQHIREIRQEMLRRPDLYPYPIPEPTFGIRDFLLGPRPDRPRLIRPQFQPAPPAQNSPGSQPDFRPPIGPRPGMQPGMQPGMPAGPPYGPQGPPNGPLPPQGPPNGPQPLPPAGMDRPAIPQPGAVVGPPAGPNPVPRPDGRDDQGSGPWLMLLTRTLIALLLAMVAGKLLSRSFTRRLDALADGARAFNEGNFTYRIDEKGQDEFSQVGEVMNKMAARVSSQVSRLEDDAKRRRQMLADVAHELRSPASTIRVMAGALEDGTADDPERKSRAISSLARSSERLQRLVGDLLDLARLDLNELPINPQPANLRELAANAVESHMAQAADAGIRIYPLDTGEPVMRKVDPIRLSQVLDNLIGNAIEYAGEGAEVRVSVEPGLEARIIVSDTGRGIPAVHLPYIFDPFYRVDSARTPDAGHSGLGLRISKGLIEAHGGKLAITSREGGGTTAVISLPNSR